MPVLTLSTNVVLLDATLLSSLVSQLSREVARVTGKAESYVMVLVRDRAALSFGGEEEKPGAYCELVSVGGLNPEVNMNLCQAIARVLECELSVPPCRCYFKFYQDETNSNSEQPSCLHALHQ